MKLQGNGPIGTERQAVAVCNARVGRLLVVFNAYNQSNSKMGHNMRRDAIVMRQRLVKS